MTQQDFQSKLINMHVGLMRLAYRLTSDREDAEDLVQDTYLKALRFHDKFTSGSNFKAWTFTILKNTYINSYHHSVHQDVYTEHLKSSLQNDSVGHADSETPHSVYISKEIEKLIEALDDKMKVPFIMHNQGYKYREIADELGLNVGTIKRRMFSTRQKLIKQLNA